jgi:hypothetical protein
MRLHKPAQLNKGRPLFAGDVLFWGEIMYSILNECAWETIVYAYYITQDNPEVFSDRKIAKHGRNALSQALIEGSHFMAKARKNGNTSANFSPVNWVNHSLTDEDILQIDGWQPDDGEIFAGLLGLVDTGHSLTVKAAADGSGFMAAATGNSNDCENHGLGLSAYADNARDAAKVLLYKHHGVFDKIWPKADTVGKRRYR